MKQTISFVTLGVADLARSRRFYKALGWQESSGSQQEVAFFQVGSLAFALYGREALADDAMVSADGSGFAGFSLAHNVASAKEVDATLLEAVSAGGLFQSFFSNRPTRFCATAELNQDSNTPPCTGVISVVRALLGKNCNH